MKTYEDCSTFDPFIHSIIRRLASRIVKKAGLPRNESEDLEQDLRLHLWERRSAFDPSRGRWSTFARCVIERKAACLLQAACARIRRRSRESFSLDEQEIGGGSKGDRVDQDTYLLNTGRISRPIEGLTHLKLDVGRAIEDLSLEHRSLAQALMEERVTEVSKRTGVPRSTLYDRIKIIRRALGEKKLEAYLDTAPTFSRAVE